MNLLGSTALVTGAAKRVGRAIALELAAAGCDVGVHYHTSVEEAEETARLVRARGRSAVTIGGDLNEPGHWPMMVYQCVSEFGRLDILINNASIFHVDETDTLERFDPALWDRVLRVNLTSIAGLVHHAREHLESSGSGNVINLTDSAVDRPYASNLAYSVSKGGLVTLTKALARSLAPKIHVNAVAPGIAIFPEDYGPELRDKLISRVPLKRAGTPEDIAGVIRCLLMHGDYITGAVIPVDGGRSTT